MRKESTSIHLRRGLAATVMLLAVCSVEVRAQRPAAAGDQVETPYTATVVDISERAQVIRVPVNQSVLIETSKPSERIQSIDPSIVFVQSIAPTQVLVTGVGTGTSQVLVWSDDGQQQIFQVHVEINLVELNKSLARVDALSDVEAIPLMGSIVLTGMASSTQIAERLMEVAELFVPPGSTSQSVTVRNHMTVAGKQQVLLRCTIAEVSRSAARKLGINGFLAGDNFKDAFIVNQIGGINPANIGALPFGDVTQNFGFGSPSGVPLSATVPLSLGFPRVQMQVFIQALADNSLLRILAEPNLVAISGETASFLVGGEFPIPVPQGIDQITIEFREFGVRLNFTPVVLSGQRIRLHIAPEVSELDFSSAVTIAGFSVPGLTQRRVESTVEVGNGQTLAIAGLLNDQVRGIASRIPGLGDLPILGALFRSVEYRRQITELVVLVTPEIIAPMNPNQVPDVPGQDFKDPNDFELYALGLLEPLETAGQPATGIAALGNDAALVESQPDQNTLHGPWGYATATE